MAKLAAVSLLLVGSSVSLAGAAPADRIVSTEVEGTQLKVRLESGRLLVERGAGRRCLGSRLAGGTTRARSHRASRRKTRTTRTGIFFCIGCWSRKRRKIGSIFAAPMHRAHAGRFPLRGQWDDEGRRISESGFTLICASGAIGKCVRFGYKPWKTTKDGDLARGLSRRLRKGGARRLLRQPGNHPRRSADRYLRCARDSAPGCDKAPRQCRSRRRFRSRGRVRRAHARSGERDARCPAGGVPAPCGSPRTASLCRKRCGRGPLRHANDLHPLALDGGVEPPQVH